MLVSGDEMSCSRDAKGLEEGVDLFRLRDINKETFRDVFLAMKVVAEVV